MEAESYLLHNAWLYSTGVDEYADLVADRASIAPFLEMLCDQLPSNSLVLDLGCGPGWEAATLHGRGHTAVGFDFSGPFLRYARERHDADGWVRGDMRELPFADASFDGLWACASMHHLEGTDLDAGFREASRVLRRGGAIVASFKAGDRGQYLPGQSPSDRGLYYAYQQPRQLSERAERAGLRVRELDVNIPADSRAELSEGQVGWLTLNASKR